MDVERDRDPDKTRCGLAKQMWNRVKLGVTLSLLLAQLIIILVLVVLLQDRDSSSVTVAKDAQTSAQTGSEDSLCHVPDVSYALYGYNSLQGFPLTPAPDTDPGFTIPIFTDDGKPVPQGTDLVPVKSCLITFTSSVITNNQELYEQLQTSVGVNGGVMGVTFSASTRYRQLSSEITSNRSVIIMTRAVCSSHNLKLLEDNPPRLTDDFIIWVDKLHTSDHESDYVDFLEKYGTHYTTATTFGSVYIRQYKMSLETYRQETSKGLDVRTAASFAAEVTVGGYARYSQNAREVADRFLQLVETTTITLGAAPPDNGSAEAWANFAKANPAPIRQHLAPIENLFSPQFLGAQLDPEYHTINYGKIQDLLVKAKIRYCGNLQYEDAVDNCAELSSGMTLAYTELRAQTPMEKYPVLSIDRCADECQKTADCVAVDFCVRCDVKDLKYQTCQMYTEKSGRARAERGLKNDKWEAVVLYGQVHNLTLQDTGVKGVTRTLDDPDDVTTAELCHQWCEADHLCVAFTFCTFNCAPRCTLYADKALYLVQEVGTLTTIIRTRRAA